MLFLFSKRIALLLPYSIKRGFKGVALLPGIQGSNSAFIPDQTGRFQAPASRRAQFPYDCAWAGSAVARPAFLPSPHCSHHP